MACNRFLLFRTLILLSIALRRAAEGLVPRAGVRGKCQGTCHFKVRIPRYDWAGAKNSARTSGQWCVQLSGLKRLSG